MKRFAAALWAVLPLGIQGACEPEPLERIPDTDVPAEAAEGEVEVLENLIAPGELVGGAGYFVDEPGGSLPVPSCDELPNLLDGAGYMYEVAAVGDLVAVATSSGTMILNFETGVRRRINDSLAFGLTADAPSRQLFSQTYFDEVIAFDPSFSPTTIRLSDTNLVALVANGDRLFFTDEANPGRVGSMALDGSDVQTLADLEIAHAIVVDPTGIYVAGLVENDINGARGAIGHVAVDGTFKIFYDPGVNPHAEAFDDYSFGAPGDLFADEEAVYVTAAISPKGGIVRIEKSTGVASLLAPLDEEFAFEVVGSGPWIYFSASLPYSDLGQILRVPRRGGDIEVVLDCGPTLRILGVIDGWLYLSGVGEDAVLTRLELSAH